jgi:predicted SnoaL-like aldol condensation-catalyzing enzyme
MSPTDPKLIALQFNEQINAHDIAGLAALMSADHTFIDRADQAVVGKASMLRGWTSFFAQFPHYFNTITRVESQGNLVVLHGYATWDVVDAPDYAIWTARIENDLVAEWRIYADNEENRKKFGL